MKNLLVPALTLSLVLGLAALALGAQAADSQSLVLDVVSRVSLYVPGWVVLSVGPDATDSETVSLEYAYNDTPKARSITVGVTGDLHGMTLTIKLPEDPPGGSSGGDLVISDTTGGVTLIGSMGSNGNYSLPLTFEGSTVPWTEGEGAGVLAVTYKFLN